MLSDFCFARVGFGVSVTLGIVVLCGECMSEAYVRGKEKSQREERRREIRFNEKKIRP